MPTPAPTPDPATGSEAARRTDELFSEQQCAIYIGTDRRFAWLLAFQWVAGIVLALFVSPHTWSGSVRAPHSHVQAAVFLGGLIASLPIVLAWRLPGSALTRHIVAAAQMLVSALFIHLTGGRIETHFHLFGSLAFLAFYRDWRVLATASAVAALDHLVRGTLWPQSVYGVLSATPWRSVEHVLWVAFEDAFLMISIRQGLREMRAVCARRAELELLNTAIEQTVEERTVELRCEIAERRRANEALRWSEERFALALQGANEGLWDWNLLSAEVYFSPRWTAMLGYEAHELAPHLTTFQALLCLEDRERVYALVRAFLEGRADKFEIEFRMLHKHGHLVPVLSRAHVARNAEGQPVRMIGTHMDLTERKRAEAELQESHKKLIAASRQAGMAEVATNVLHNVGNVLNSVNVSVSLIGERLQSSKAASVTRLAELLSEHRGDFSDFVMNDPRGRQLPDFVGQLARRLSAERNRMLGDLAQLRRQVDHIKRVVAMQQDHAKVSCFSEDTNITELIEDAVRLNGAGVAKQDLHVVREYAAVPTITVDRHKVLQILVNLVRNARNACEESGQAEKRLTLKVANDTEQVRISVSDNGVGIPAENLTRIFNHGFTTRKDGHGFGLHSAALAACELGGTLTVHSDGPGRGATFTLELPLQSNFANQ